MLFHLRHNLWISELVRCLDCGMSCHEAERCLVSSTRSMKSTSEDFEPAPRDTRPESVQAMFDRAVEQYGPVLAL